MNSILTKNFALCEISTMKVSAYLEETGESLTEFAKRLGIPVTTLHGYLSFRRTPNATMVVRIEHATDGKVRAADLIAESAGERAA